MNDEGRPIRHCTSKSPARISMDTKSISMLTRSTMPLNLTSSPLDRRTLVYLSVSLVQYFTFDENGSEPKMCDDDQGHQVRVQHETLDGLSLDFASSNNNQSCPNRSSTVDHSFTFSPTILHPIVSKDDASVFRTREYSTPFHHRHSLTLTYRERLA